MLARKGINQEIINYSAQIVEQRLKNFYKKVYNLKEKA